MFLSLAVVGTFVVTGSWARTSLLYHLYVPVGTALVCGGLLLVWWPRIQHLPGALRAAAALACIAATNVVLYGVTLAWPKVLVYGGAGDLEGVRVGLIVALVGTATALLFVPLSLLAERSNSMKQIGGG